jgi:uncharacterized membrane protein
MKGKDGKMLQRKATEVKERVGGGAELAAALARDKKFRKRLLSAIAHTETARRRAAQRIGLVATAKRLAADEQLRDALREASANLRKAWSRVEKKRRHRLRNALLVLAGAGAVASVPQSRRWLARLLRTANIGEGTKARVIQEAIEVDVPVSTAYNQWTQFEDFPLFMEGIDHVQQLDDTRLHWVATIGGRTAEWDAKILEQEPDSQISWISEDGKKTRGTVSFEPRGEDRTLVRLSMSYQAEGPVETVGSAAGLDQQRVRADLERYKTFIESRGQESGAWRGKVSTGKRERQG